MKKLSLAVFTAVAIFVSLNFTSCGYNTLVSEREAVNSQWANVESQYQRRADLVPNLVATVQGIASHETEVFTAIADARAKIGSTTIDSSAITEDADKMQQFQQAQSELSSGLSRLLAVSEAYPELTSSQNFLDLQSQLEGCENRIATERKRYNETAQSYNKTVQSIPTAITAKIFGFKTKEYFKADASASQAPVVSF